MSSLTVPEHQAPSGIDPQRVREAFDRRAAAYDAEARVQKRVAWRVLERLETESYVPRRVLDLGAGTGFMARRLCVRYPEALVVCLDLAPGMNLEARNNLSEERTGFVTADVRSVPLATGSFDLVVSTSTLQWLSKLDGAFAEAFRVLAPGRSFRFCLFGGATLRELKTAYRAALREHNPNAPDRTHAGFSTDDVFLGLRESGFSRIEIGEEWETEQYRDVPELLRSLRMMGAGNASTVPVSGLAERRVTLAMISQYQDRFGRNGRIPATYQVIYGCARR